MNSNLHLINTNGGGLLLFELRTYKLFILEKDQFTKHYNIDFISIDKNSVGEMTIYVLNYINWGHIYKHVMSKNLINLLKYWK
jgi:hypothetical protein